MLLATHLAALALAATTLVASGCGSSSKNGSTSSSTAASAATTTTTATTAPSLTAPTTTAAVVIATGKPLTSAEWISKGDAICARLVAQVAASTARTQQELAHALAQKSVYEKAELAKLAKLVPPSSKQSDWQTYLNGLSELADNSAKLAETAQTGKLNLHSSLVASSQEVEKGIHAIATSDGFKHCSQV